MWQYKKGDFVYISQRVHILVSRFGCYPYLITMNKVIRTIMLYSLGYSIYGANNGSCIDRKQNISLPINLHLYKTKLIIIIK